MQRLERTTHGHEVGRRRGRGGFAVVFEAIPPTGGPAVALKLPRDDVPLAKARLAREIDQQGQLDPPNVMPITAAGQAGVWFSMPLATDTLERLWQEHRVARDPQDAAVDVRRQIG